MSTSPWSPTPRNAEVPPATDRARSSRTGADPTVVGHIHPMSHASDAAVVARVLSGDREAFGTLVDRHQDRMVAFVRHMGFGPEETLDIVQDGFVRAFRHLRRCGDPERFSGWLFRIVSNVARTAATRRARTRTDSIDDHGATLPSDLPDPESRMERAWTRDRIREALDTVPHDQREALILMYLEGYTVAEIEELTGASQSAIKMRLKRGREAMERVLAPLFVQVEER